MKIDLNKLRKAGWHVDTDMDAAVELSPPPMQVGDHKMLISVIKQQVKQPLSVDMVLGQLYSALGRAALLEAMED